MKNDLDELLRDDLLQVPPDFAQHVMQQVQQLPQAPALSATPAATRIPFRKRLRRMAAMVGLIGGGILGLSQIAGFVFTLWLSATAI